MTPADRPTDRPAAAGPGLDRALSLWQVTVSGVGIVIGAGIYVLVGEAAAEAGSLVWASFIIAAILGALTGLSYAELASLFPTAGAEYEFARRAFNEFTGYLVGWLMIAGNVIGAGAVALGFAEYARHFVTADTRLLAVVMLVVLAAAVSAGVRLWIWFTTVLVILEVGGLLLVILVGAPHIGEASLMAGTPRGVLSAAALVFFAFIGFDEVVTLSDETQNPTRVIPRALLLSLGISTVLYVAVAVAAVSVIPWEVLAASDRPLALVIERAAGGRASDVVAWLALASTTSTTLLLLTASARIIYAMARQGSLPSVLGAVSRRARAPWVATLAALAVALAFALTGQLRLVASVTDVAVYAQFITVNLAVLRLRRSMPETPRPMRAGPSVRGVPVTPILGLLTTIVMLLFLDQRAWALGGVLVGVAIVVRFIPGRRVA